MTEEEALLKDEKNEKPKPTAKVFETPLKLLVTNVVKFKEVKSAAIPGGSVFCVNIENSMVFIQEFLSVLIGCKGNWQSLGMSYNPDISEKGMEIVIQYSILSDNMSQFEASLKKLVDSKIDGETDEKESS